MFPHYLDLLLLATLSAAARGQPHPLMDFSWLAAQQQQSGGGQKNVRQFQKSCDFNEILFYDTDNENAPLNITSGSVCSISGRYGIVLDFHDNVTSSSSCTPVTEVSIVLFKSGDDAFDTITETSTPFSLFGKNGTDILGNELDAGLYLLAFFVNGNLSSIDGFGFVVNESCWPTSAPAGIR